MLAAGDNTFKLPHLEKDKAERAGTPLPKELPCSPEAWAAGQEELAAAEGGASA